jgi:serine/threonine protein kinase
MHEALLWRMLRHPNILPLLGIYTVDIPSIGRAIPTFYMVSEWMERGTVRDYLSSGMNNRSDEVKLLVRPNDACYNLSITDSSYLSIRALQLKDVAHGLAYMHDLTIVHGDIRGVSGP